MGDARPLALEVVHRDVGDLEVDRNAALAQRRDLVLDDLLLAVDRDLPAGEPEHVDVEGALAEAQVHAGVVEALAGEPVADADGVQQVDRVLLEQAGTDAVLDVLAAAVLEHDAVDPRPVEQQREREPRRPGPDDPDLGPHGLR